MGLFNRGVNEDVLRAMHEAGWFPADPITLRTSIEIVGSVVLDRPYHDAPVSPLYYNGKTEQLAFEKPDGGIPESPKSVDHVFHLVRRNKC
jgi:LssY C-terminus